MKDENSGLSEGGSVSDNELIAAFVGITVRRTGDNMLYHSEADGYIDFEDGSGPYWPDLDWNQLMLAVENIDNRYYNFLWIRISVYWWWSCG